MGIVEEALVPLVNKIKNLFCKKDTIEERISKIESSIVKIDEQIKNLSVATKGIYELLNSVIHIASKH